MCRETVMLHLEIKVKLDLRHVTKLLLSIWLLLIH